MELPSVTIEKLITKIDDLITSINSSRSTGGSDAGGSRSIPMPDMSSVKEGIGNLGTLFKTLALDGADVAVVFKSMAGNKDAVMSVFETVAGKAGKIPGKVAQTISGAVQKNVQATALGANPDATLQARQEATNRVDYNDIIKNMRDAGTGGSSFGTLTGDSLVNINKTLEKINIDSTKRITGGTTDSATLAKALIISQQGSRGNLANAGDQDRAAINAGKLADEIDKTAVATKRSREEVANELAARVKNSQYILAQFGTNEEARQSYIRSQTALARNGQAVQDLANDFINFGTATEKTQGTLVALGPAGMELRSAMLQLKNATNEQERAAAEARVRSASIKIDERRNDPRLARMAAMADAFPELKALQGARQQFEQNQSAAGTSYFRNQGISPEAARGAQDQQVANRQAGGNALGGPATLGQELTQLSLIGNRDAAIGAGIAFDKLNSVLKDVVTPIKLITDSLNKIVPPRTSAPSAPNTSNAGKNDSRDIGTLGKTGQMFEPKDIIALLHKGERVLNPKENIDLTNLYEMIGNLKPKSSAEKTEEVPDLALTGTATVPEETGTDSITLKDVYDSLQRLNSTMEIMADHTADMKDSNRTTADMSQKMTGNRLAV